jgi:hypothetical protein
MYRITITKVEEKRVERQGNWVTLEQRPWTPKELQGSVYDSPKGDSFLKENPLKEIKGYAPNTTSTEEREVEILKQNVETLDLAAVIKAINGL